MPRKSSSLSRLAIPGIHRILAWFIVLVYILLLMSPSLGRLLVLDPGKVLDGQVWRIFTGFLIPLGVPDQSSSGLLLGFLFLYIAFRLITFMGDSLENVWGIEKLNAVIFGTVAAVGIASLLTYFYDPYLGRELGIYSSRVLYMAIFLGFAIEFPDIEFLLMFIIPVKVKWLGWVAVILVAWTAFALSRQAGSPIPFFHTLISYAPLLRIAIPRVMGNAKAYKRRTQFKNTNEKARQIDGAGAFHSCSVCETTDVKEPGLQFRVLEDGEEICERCLEERQKAD